MNVDSMAETDLNLPSDSLTRASWIIRLMSSGPLVMLGLVSLLPSRPSDEHEGGLGTGYCMLGFPRRVGGY